MESKMKQLTYIDSRMSPKHSIQALKAIAAHYDEIIANQQNEIQLLRAELAAYGHPYYQESYDA